MLTKFVEVLKLAAALLDDWVSCRLRHASGSTPAVGGETALEDSPTPTPPWSTARVAAQRAPAASAVQGQSSSASAVSRSSVQPASAATAVQRQPPDVRERGLSPIPESRLGDRKEGSSRIPEPMQGGIASAGSSSAVENATPAPATPPIIAAQAATEDCEDGNLRELRETLCSRLVQVRTNVEPDADLLDLGLQRDGAHASSIGDIECCSRPLMPLLNSVLALSLRVKRLHFYWTSLKVLWSALQSGPAEAQWLG